MLVDRFGKEISSNKPIIEEIAVQTVRDRYGSYPSSGLTPQRLASIFKEADQGDVSRQAELFEEMEEKDLHLAGIIQTRKLAVSGLDWEILPASDNDAEASKIAAAAKEMMEYIENFEDALLDMLDAIGKGFAVQEIMWEIAEGKVWAKEVEWIHQRRFTFNSPAALLESPRLLTDDEPVWGEELIPNKFVVHKYRARSGATARGGLFRPCAWMFLFKNFDIKNWLIFNELFAVPMRVGKYKPGTQPDEIAKLKQAVFNLGVDAAAVVSDTTMIELVESKLRGDVSSFEKFEELCDKSMSKCVLGHTGSAEGTPGKLGGEGEARDVRQDLLEADAKAVQKTIRFQLLAPWVAYNYGPATGVPKFKLHFEGEEDLEKTAKTYGTLVKDVNFEGIPESHIHERFGIPKPADGEKTVKAQTQGGFQNNVQGQKMANKGIIVKNAAGDAEAEAADWVTTYMSRLGPALLSVRTTALDGIEEWLKSLASPPTETEFTTKAHEILGAAYEKLDAKAITEVVSDMYLLYRNIPGVQIGFGGPDIRAINFLSGLDNFYVSSFIKNPEAQRTVAEFLSQRYLEQGAGLFGRGAPEDAQAFRDLFSQKLADLEDWQVRRIVDTSVQRTRNWASTAQLHEAGIMEIEIYEPTKGCAFCAGMNGQTISVPVAYTLMTKQMGMTPGEYEQDIKSVPPIEANAAAMAGAGRLPPYHPHCHGTVLKRVVK